mmetsp:Transcript_61829/g.182547  ORF Transcript_61829/g.182547 Transcript_61829/m.182547 type:complete len:328 (-) Transcript_61829:914-1897(-)
MGYAWPKITKRLPPFVPRTRPVVDERKVDSRESLTRTNPAPEAKNGKEAILAVVKANKTSVAAPVLNSTAGVVVWIVQGQANISDVWNKRFQDIPNTKLIYHSYDAPCSDCIFQANTTWLTGNNLMMRHAVKEPHVKYIVRSDGDLTMKCKRFGKELDCWRNFNSLLLQENVVFPIVSPKTWHDPRKEGNLYQSCTDHAMLAVRPDYIPLLFPMATFRQEHGWNLVAHAHWEIMDRCAPNSILTRADFRIKNPVHRKYPQVYLKGIVENHINAILEHDYAELGPWNITKRLRHRCNTTTNSPLPMDSHCRLFLTERFDSWISETAVR